MSEKTVTISTKILSQLVARVNRVTAYHRHGTVIPKQALDDLANVQIDVEKALREEVEEKNNE